MRTVEEREDKYDVPDDYAVPDLTGLAGATVERGSVGLHTTYYDTASHTLLACRVTLRRRDGDADAGWQLKVPGKTARTEIRLPLGDAEDVPVRLAELVAGLCGSAPLHAVAELRTERRLHRLVADGRMLVEIADDQVRARVFGSVLAESSWREVEAELGAGDEKLLAQVGARLRDAGATPSPSRSKLARALGEIDPVSGAAQLMRAYLGEQLAALAAGDIALRRGLDPIHRTRVAVRRVRSALRVYGRVFATDTSVLGAELSWYQDLLGAVRDPQVQRARFADVLRELPVELVLGPVVADIEQALLTEQGVARGRLVAALDTDRYRALVRDVAALAQHPLLRPGTSPDALRRLARKTRRKARRRLDDALRAGDDVALHAARKALKRSRYASELVAPLEGKAAKRIAKQHKKIQDVLGEHQDSVVAAELLRSWGARFGAGADRNGFTFGLLYQRELDRAERARAAALRWR